LARALLTEGSSSLWEFAEVVRELAKRERWPE
jgi:hypothetical protein